MAGGPKPGGAGGVRTPDNVRGGQAQRAGGLQEGGGGGEVAADFGDMARYKEMNPIGSGNII